MLNRIVTNIYLRKIILLLCQIISYVNMLIPKHNKWVLFYESVDSELHDNSRSIYNYMHRNKPEYKYFICASNVTKNRHLSSSDTKVIGQFKGVLCFLLCKYCFYSYASLRIKPSKNQVVVNLWHGTPLKVIGNLSKDKINKGENMNMFSYLLASSDFFAPIMKNAFECNDHQILVCGHARTDELFESISNPYLDEIKKFKKAIIWMPTFRISNDRRHKDLGENYNYSNSETLLPIFDKYSDLQQLNTYCKEQDILIVIKVHSLAKINDIHLDNIRLINDSDLEKNNLSLYQLIGQFDALITDYSSVFFDFLLLNRPIGFTIDDISLYQNARGFAVENALEFMPGHHIETIQTFYGFIQDVIVGKDLYYQERNRVNNLCNQYQDNHNCQRLLEQIGL